MSTYSSDFDLPQVPDESGRYVVVSSSRVDERVRMDWESSETSDEYFMTPDYARQLAAALIRQAENAERYKA